MALLKKNGLDPVWWTRSEGRIRCPEWDQAKQEDARADSSRRSSRPALPRALVPLRGRVYCQGSRFPETATTSLGVLQPWPLPSSRLVSQEIRLP